MSAPGGVHSAVSDLQLLLHPMPMQMAFIELSGLKQRWGMHPRGSAHGPAYPDAGGRGNAAAPDPPSLGVGFFIPFQAEDPLSKGIFSSVLLFGLSTVLPRQPEASK